jgi:hypothetical protein
LDVCRSHGVVSLGFTLSAKLEEEEEVGEENKDEKN